MSRARNPIVRRAFEGAWRLLSPLGMAVSAARRIKRGTVFSVALSCTFFVSYYFYVREYLNPPLLYHAHAVLLPSRELVCFPIFQQGTVFLGEFLARPGGLSEYLGARYCQYYWYPNLGALVLTVVALLVYLAGDWLIRLGGRERSRGLRFVFPLLLLMVYNQYTFQLASCFALVAALTATVVYLLVANRVDRVPVRAAVFAALSVAVYYAAGGMYVLLAVLCALSELLTKRRYVLGGLYLLAAAGVPLLGKYLFDVSLAAAYFRPCGLYGFEKVLSGASSTEALLSGEQLSEKAWSASYRLSAPRQLGAPFVPVPLIHLDSDNSGVSAEIGVLGGGHFLSQRTARPSLPQRRVEALLGDSGPVSRQRFRGMVHVGPGCPDGVAGELLRAGGEVAGVPRRNRTLSRARVPRVGDG